MDSNLLTVAQVAEKLGVNKQMVYELIKDGLLKSVRLGYKTIRVAPDDLKQFLEQQKEKKDWLDKEDKHNKSSSRFNISSHYDCWRV